MSGRREFLMENSYVKYKLMKKYIQKRSATNIIYLERNIHGEFHNLFEELRSQPLLFKQYARMLPTTFDYIVDKIKPLLELPGNNFKQPISVEERLMVTLRYLATGIQFRQLAFSFRISKSAISTIVRDVCKAIWTTLLTKHMPEPTEDDFKKIAQCFWERWQFPNCIGKPKKSGSMYYCYKSFFSIGLLAVTDANYKFIMVNVGSYGKENDAGVFNECPFRRAIESGTLIIPEEKLLPGSHIKAPYVILGDAAFPLKDYLMRPFPERTTTNGDSKDNFNYRLSRARMVVECSFGSIASKFRILNKPIETNVENAVHIVKAITLLHNIIRDLESTSEAEVVSFQDTYKNIPRTPQDNLGLVQRRFNASSQTAIQVRENFKLYFEQHPIERM